MLIINISSNSPSSTAGLQPGDVIVAINGKNMTNASQVADVVTGSQIGQSLQVTHQRNSTQSTVKITITQNPSS